MKQSTKYNRLITEHKERFWKMLAIVLFIGLIGAMFNFKVIQNNNGRMPVLNLPPEQETFRHSSFTKENKVPYWMLADIIRIPPFGTMYIMRCSIGDLFIYTSISIYAYYGFMFFYLKHKIKRELKKEKRR